jgi:cholesterol 7alpha-monooxygenase
MGESLYVIPSADDVQAVYRAPKTLDFDPFVKKVLGHYGINADTTSKMFDTPPGHNRNLMESWIEDFKLQMHPGSKLDVVQARLLGIIDDLLVWNRLRGRMVLENGEQERVVSLYKWSEMVIVDAQTRAFFDDPLYEKCPDLLAHYQTYEDEGWKALMDVPEFTKKALRHSQSSIEQGLRHYIRLPKDKKPHESWIITTLCEGMESIGLEESQRAHVLFSFYRV